MSFSFWILELQTLSFVCMCVHECICVWVYMCVDTRGSFQVSSSITYLLLSLFFFFFFNLSLNPEHTSW